MRQAAVVEYSRPCGHRRPRGIADTQPSRVLRVWNMETPTGSGVLAHR